MKRFQFFFAILSAVLLVGGVAHTVMAGPIYSSFGPEDNYNTAAGWVIGGPYGYSPGFLFKPNYSATLGSIELAAKYFYGLDQFNLELRYDAGSQPGAIIESYSFSGVASSPGKILFQESRLMPYLDSNTFYWLVASTNAVSKLNWRGNAIGVETAFFLTYPGGSFFSDNEVAPAFRLNPPSPDNGSPGWGCPPGMPCPCAASGFISSTITPAIPGTVITMDGGSPLPILPNGYFILPYSAGNYQLKVTAPGCTDYSTDVEIAERFPPTHVNIVLNCSSCTSTIISSTNKSFTSSGGTGRVGVTAAESHCPWSAINNASWISITAGSSGTGNGSVSYSVSANTTGRNRQGTMTIGGQTFTITQNGPNTPLYFPHVDTNLPWQTEIAIINTSSDQSVTGTLRAFSNDGRLTDTKAVALPAHGRRQITVADEFTNHINIGYIIFDANSDTVQGYTKFYKEGIYRTSTPAVKEVNVSDIYIPHIASDAQWWTGISLLNTTPSTKEFTIIFNNGRVAQGSIPANERLVFTIASLFNNQPQPDIKSAVITNASGIIGLEYFGGSKQLEGILLTDKAASTLYFPHLDSNGWWTGIVAYNPSELGCTMTITPYSAQGIPLSSTSLPLAGRGKYVGVVTDLDLPLQTAWFKIDSSRPLSGFELFGTADNQQLAPYAVTGGTGGREGVFAKIEKNGWTGIAFVNTEDSTASVTLTAYNDGGTAVATSMLSVGSHAKVVNLAAALFSQETNSASYIAYSSDRNVVGFQLNGSADWTMLDGLPALGGTN